MRSENNPIICYGFKKSSFGAQEYFLQERKDPLSPKLLLLDLSCKCLVVFLDHSKKK